MYGGSDNDNYMYQNRSYSIDRYQAKATASRNASLETKRIKTGEQRRFPISRLLGMSHSEKSNHCLVNASTDFAYSHHG
jgi:hypothetical protein